MAKQGDNSFLLTYLNQLTTSNISIDHLELLSKHLQIHLKCLLNEAIVKECDKKLIDALEAILASLFSRKLIDNQTIKLNEIEINFIVQLCKLFNCCNKVKKIDLLILSNDQIELELKIEIVQCLFEEQSIQNDLLYIEFIFKSLGLLFKQFKELDNNQMKTKLINKIIFILFGLLRNDQHSKRIIEELHQFLNKLINDNQLVEFILDLIANLIACLLKFADSKSSNDRLKLGYVKQIETIIRSEKVKEIVLINLNHKTNSSIRKKARFIASKFKLISLNVLEYLEVLEENQLHLIQPFIDMKLNCSSLIQLNEDIKPFKSIMEILIQRMFRHDRHFVRRCAFQFIQNYYSKNQNQIEFLSEQFILNQIILAMQDNEIYDQSFDEASFSFLNSICKFKILNSLLDKESQLTLFGLFFILKQLYLNDKCNQTEKKNQNEDFNVYSVQRLFGLFKIICCDLSIRIALQIYLASILIQNLRDCDAADFEYLLNVLYCCNIKEVKIQFMLSIDKLPKYYAQIKLDQINLANDCILIGLARYWSIIYDEKNQSLTNCFIQFLDELLSLDSSYFKSFLTYFLAVITKCTDDLYANLAKKLILIDNLAILQLICKKEIEPKATNKIQAILIDKFRQENDLKIKFHLICLLNDLESNNKQIKSEFKSNFNQLINELFVVLESNNFKLEIQDEKHWQLLNKYLSNMLSNQTKFNLNQIIHLLKTNLNLNESKSDLFQSLTIKTSTDLNCYVIKFLSLILSDELANEMPIAQTSILKDFFTFTDILFNSCLEMRNVHYYKKIFKVFIREFAFCNLLFKCKESQLFFASEANQMQFSNLFDEIDSINSQEVKSILVDHLANLVRENNGLIKNELFAGLLLKNLEIGCLCGSREQNLLNHLKQQLSKEQCISNCFNFPLKFDLLKKTRSLALSVCLKLDLNTLIRLIERMIVIEIKINQNSKIKNYPNSSCQRRQSKIWQFILIITLKLLKLLNSKKDEKSNEDTIKEMLKAIYEFSISSIISESSGTQSVKLLQQLIIIILIKDKKCPNEFYVHFKNLLTFDSTSSFLTNLSRNEDNEIVKINYIVTLLTIVFHLIPFKSELKFFPINYLLTCNHFKTRLFSHLILVKREIEIELSIDQNQTLKFQNLPKSISGSTNIVSHFY